MTDARPDFRSDKIPTGPATRILSDRAEQYPDLKCLDFLGAIMTYGEVWSAVRHAARGLQDMGVKPGDRVGLCLPNSPYYVIGYYAILVAGGTVVNFNPLYTAAELRHQIVDSGTQVMFTLDLKSIYGKVAKSLHTTCLRSIVVCALSDALPPVKSLLFHMFKRAEIAQVPNDLAHVPFALLVADKDDPKAVVIDPNTDIAVLQYTGGTTGVPKGAMLTHANVRANTEQVRLWLGETQPGQERILCVIPFFHVFAMTAAMNMGLATGATLILLPRFDRTDTLDVITQKKPTLFPAVPTLYAALVNGDDLDRYDLSSIRYGISGGAPLPAKIKESFEAASHGTLVEGYGLSEASPVVACNPPRRENKTGSIGLPLPWTKIECRTFEDPDRCIAPGEQGELVVRGPQIMKGYWNNDKETKAVLKDGWLKTGDVGYVDEDGYVFLTDRLKDIIICSGFNVYPHTIETVLYAHEAVQDAIVIAVPDDYRGEVPKAFVALKPGAHVSGKDLLAFAHDRLNPIERPIDVEIRSELPKTMIGKLSKKELVEEQKNIRQLSKKEQTHG